jgi:hypothetical protein
VIFLSNFAPCHCLLEAHGAVDDREGAFHSLSIGVSIGICETAKNPYT